MGLDALALHFRDLKLPSGIVSNLSHVPRFEPPTMASDHRARHLSAGLNFRRSYFKFAIDSGEARQANHGVRGIDANADDRSSRVVLSAQENPIGKSHFQNSRHKNVAGTA